MHLDHGNTLAGCATVIRHGFTSVMMDGSLHADGKTPADHAHNRDVTAEVVHLAHACGVSVEGELGVLGSLETGTGDQEDGHGATGTLSQGQLLTDPAEAGRFVVETGVDALAIAMGTSHGAYKVSREPDGAILAMHVIEEIQRGIQSGLRKVNIDTDNRPGMTAAIRKTPAEDPAEFGPRKYLQPVLAMMTEI